MQRRVFDMDVPDDLEPVPLDPPAAERLAQLSMPMLVLVGALDRPEKLALAQRLAAELPDARAVTIGGAAHMLNMEKPDLFNTEVLKFLT